LLNFWFTKIPQFEPSGMKRYWYSTDECWDLLNLFWPCAILISFLSFQSLLSTFIRVAISKSVIVHTTALLAVTLMIFFKLTVHVNKCEGTVSSRWWQRCPKLNLCHHRWHKLTNKRPLYIHLVLRFCNCPNIWICMGKTIVFLSIKNTSYLLAGRSI